MSKFYEFEEDDDEEELDWKDSYSDLVTDLLAVFVLLLSFAMVNQAAASAAAKKVDMSPNISILSENNGLLWENGMVSRNDDFNELYESMKAYIDGEDLSQKLNVTMQGNDQILLRVSDSVLFNPGSADINPNAEPFLEKISKLFAAHDQTIKMVRVEGHTDNVPMKNDKFNSNWELSVIRAVNVLEQLMEMSTLKSEQLSAVGYSEFHPIATNDTSEGRAQNRRVDFFIESVSSTR